MTDEQMTEDTQQAHAEIQAMLQQVQVQALYESLVQSRAEVARMRRELAEAAVKEST